MVRNSQGASGESTVVKELAKTSQSWDGNSLPAYPSGQPKITILRISIPAGARLDIHSHPVINAGVLISGELTVLTKDGKTLGGKGDGGDILTFGEDNCLICRMSDQPARAANPRQARLADAGVRHR